MENRRYIAECHRPAGGSSGSVNIKRTERNDDRYTRDCMQGSHQPLLASAYLGVILGSWDDRNGGRLLIALPLRLRHGDADQQHLRPIMGSKDHRAECADVRAETKFT